MSDASEVTVVIPAWNAAGTVGAQLDALADQVRDMAAEIIVVDDHSSDDTSAAVTAWAAVHPGIPLRLARAHTRGGANASRNIGAFLARGRLLAFADGDDIVQPGWLAALCAANEPGAIITGVLVEPGQYDPIRAATNFGLPAAFGGCMAMSKEVFDQVGGFDTNIRRGGTETEFMLCAQLVQGIRIVETPHAVVEYHTATSTNSKARAAVQRERGHTYIACRYRTFEALVAPRYTVRFALHGAAKACIRLLKPSERARRQRRVLELVRCCAVLFWLARFSAHMPVARRATTTDLVNYSMSHPGVAAASGPEHLSQYEEQSE